MNAFDACYQIRLDAKKGKGKKCPGGYSIPAGKQCGGKEKKKKLGSPGGIAFSEKGAIAGGIAGLGLGAGVGAYVVGKSSREKEEGRKIREKAERAEERINVGGVDYTRRTIEAATGKTP